MDELKILYDRQIYEGERSAYKLRWFILLFLIPMAVSQYFISDSKKAAFYFVVLLLIALIYNFTLSRLFKTVTYYKVIMYISVTIDSLLLSAGYFISSLSQNPVIIASTALIMLYPLIIFFSGIRFNKILVIYCTVFSVLTFNFAFYIRYPSIDPALLKSMEINISMDQVYKSFYMLLFGVLTLIMPDSVYKLLKKQSRLLDEKHKAELDKNIEEQKRSFLEQQFYRFVSKEIAESILNDQSVLASKKVYISAMFIDIRGFTKYVYENEPKLVIDFLNHFYTICGNCIKKYDGFINKYIGDSVFAIFGAPNYLSNPSEAALKCAKDIAAEFHRQNAEILEKYNFTCEIGIGLNYGDAIAGNIGTDIKLEYTALGNVINIASRLEKMNKELETNILFTGDLKQKIQDKEIQDKIRILGKHSIRGIEEKLELYTLIS